MPAIDIADPATGRPLGSVPSASPAEVATTTRRASTAARDWARTAPAARAALLKAGARRLRACTDELALLQTREMGKPIADSRGGIEAGIATVEQYAELGPVHRGRALQGGWDAADLMAHVPFGVAACILPWNDPVAVGLGLIGACVVTGNTVVVKPSERAPLAVSRAVELLALPKGVLSLVHGGGEIGAALVGDPNIDLVCHVGSVSTGRSIAETCARSLKKAVLELGGNDALIVDDGVDAAWAARQAATGAFANAGQICTSVERIYVHQAVATRFLEELVAAAGRLVMGDGRDPATDLGPLVDERHRQTVHRHVLRARATGAKLLCGGRIPDGPGSFYPATVLSGCTDAMTVMQDETFGPVAPVAVVGSFQEAIACANASDYGLAATVLTPSHRHAQEAWRELSVGTVKVNAVFGGAPGGAAHPHRHSGNGFGYGPELLDEVTRTRVVHLAVAP